MQFDYCLNTKACLSMLKSDSDSLEGILIIFIKQ